MTEELLQPIEVRRAYPRWVTLGEGPPVRLRLMTPGDLHRVLAFARSLPERDLQFLRVDITRMLVVMQWVQNIKAGKTVTVVAEQDGELLGYASLHIDQVSWQRHLGDLRVQTAPAWRGRGLGRRLAREVFAFAPELGLRRIVGQMSAEQQQAIALLERAGFRREAVLRDFVIDRSGRTSDLVLMTCDVAALPPPAD